MREKSDPMLPYHCYGLDHFCHEYEALARVDTDGCWYKRDEVDAELAALREEVEDQAGLIKRLSDLLNSAVNVLRGPPPDDTLWSFHDVAERAEALRARVAELEAALRYAGKHPEDCVRDDPGPCTSHMAYLEVEARVAALEAWLRTYDAWLEQPHPQGGTNLDHVPDGQPINADEVLRATESAGGGHVHD